MTSKSNSMKILLTGATGYIGKRVLLSLVKQDYQIVCCTRDKKRFNPPKSIIDNIEVIEVDLLKKETLANIPKDIDAAYYLVHSMSSSKDYTKLEYESACNFRETIDQTSAKQVIYLSGIVNEVNYQNIFPPEKMWKKNFKKVTTTSPHFVQELSLVQEVLPLKSLETWLKNFL